MYQSVHVPAVTCPRCMFYTTADEAVRAKGAVYQPVPYAKLLFSGGTRLAVG